MPSQITPDEMVRFLQRFLTHNKARGMVAELALQSELGISGSLAESKLLSGGWLLSPKVDGAPHYRYWISVLPRLYNYPDELHNAILNLERNRTWQAVATFMAQSGLGVIVSGALPPSPVMSLENLRWQHYRYQNETLYPVEDEGPFASWPGDRGRASKGDDWQPEVLDRFYRATETALTELVLRQAFFYGYLKSHLRKPVEDPYDVDAFVVGFSGTVMPMEIKEKSPTPAGDFGIDAGRILMLLRLCLATDSNALYVIREIETSATRTLVGWRYITLADLIMGCRWNLQAGGRGMSGGATQTVMISRALFKDFSSHNFSEEWLAQHKSLQGAVRAIANDLAVHIENFLRPH